MSTTPIDPTMLAAVGDGVANYLHDCTAGTLAMIANGLGTDAAGLHAVANMTASPNVAEIAYEIAEEIEAAWTREDRRVTSEEQDAMLAAGFALAADVARLARVIIEHATGSHATGGLA